MSSKALEKRIKVVIFKPQYPMIGIKMKITAGVGDLINIRKVIQENNDTHLI
jgi:hypothetical protein